MIFCSYKNFILSVFLFFSFISSNPAFSAVPQAGTITPSSGSSGPNETVLFTTTCTDPDGWQDIQSTYFFIGASLSSPARFYGCYNQNTNRLYLRNDGSSSPAWLGGYNPGSSNIIETSYVKLDCAASSVSGDGTTLTIIWSITFEPASTGTKDMYLCVIDDTNNSSGWVKRGRWTIGEVDTTPAVPQAGTITPSSGSSNPSETVSFTTTYTDPDGWQDIQTAYFFIGASLSSSARFYGCYNQNTNRLYLRNDESSSPAWLGGYNPGSANIIETSYVKLDCAASSVSGDGTTLTIVWSITFKPASTGTKDMYLCVIDDTNNSSGWVKKGTWTIGEVDTTPAVPQAGTITPSSGSSNPSETVSFTTTCTDPDGWQDIQSTYFFIGASLSSPARFYGCYNQNTNRLYLRNDGSSSPAWLGGYNPGSSNIIETSYVKLDCAASSVSGDGTTLTIIWSITFKPASTGTKDMYLCVIDDTNNSSGWVKKGTWMIEDSDITPPSGSVIINGNAVYADSTQVTLTLSATDPETGVTQMQFSNDNTNWSSPEDYSATKTWTLTTGDGTKTVYAKYKNGAGLWSSPVSDSIILDTILPQIEITSPENDHVTSQTHIDISGTITEINIDTITVNGIQAVIDGSIFTAEGVALESEGDNTITAQATDLAGNQNTHQINVIRNTTGPGDPGISIDEGEYTNNINIHLNLSAEGATEMIINEDPDFSGAEWEPYMPTKAFTLTSGDGPKTVYVKYRDELQNETQPVNDTITLDQTLPEVGITSPGDGDITNQTQITVTGSYTELNLDTITINNLPVTITDGTFTLENLSLMEGANTITVVVTDLAANTTQDTVNITLDTTPPQNPSISIQEGEYTNTRNITLNLSAGGAAEMAIGENPDFPNPEWEPYTTTRVFTLTEGDGNKTVYVKYRDLAQNETEAVNDSIILDTIPPTGSITINDNATYTSSTEVTLTLSATDPETGVTEMQFSNDGTNWSTPEAYSTTKTWTLTTEDGTKTVYVKYKNGAGLWSSAVSDDIILETTLPTGTITINDNATYTSSTEITLTLLAEDPESGVTEMQFSNDNTNWSTPENYSTTKAWTLSTGDGTKTVYVKYKNGAELWSSAYSDNIILETTPPVISDIITTPNPFSPNSDGRYDTTTFTASFSEEADWELKISDTLNTVKIFSGSGTGIGQTWDGTDESGSVLPDGEYSYIIAAVDLAGNTTVSSLNTVIIDTEVPQNPSISINEGDYTYSQEINLTLSVDNAEEMIISEDSSFSDAEWEVYTTSKTFTLSDGHGEKTIYAKFRNLGGESDTVSDTITLVPLFTDKIFPPVTGIMVGAFEGESITDTFTSFDDLIDADTIDRAKLIYSFYWPWIGNSDYTADSEWHDFDYVNTQLGLDTKIEQGYIILLTWEPHHAWESDHLPGVEEQTVALDEIINGDYDEYIETWASQIASWDEPLFLNFAPEMNTTWHTWSIDGSSNTAEKYIGAYKRVRHIFEANGAGNVTWVWAPYCKSDSGIEGNSIEDSYPGDDYVHWFGISVYNWGTTQPTWSSEWETFDELFQGAYSSLTGLSSSKPIIITAFASAEDGGDKSGWISNAFTVMQSNYPNIKASVWLHTERIEENDVTVDWRIDSSTEAKESIRDVLYDDHYLLNLTIGDKTIDQLIRMEANYILGCQFNPEEDDENYASRGSINDIFGGPTWVVPREMGLAILGLVKAYDLLGDSTFLERAELAAEYLETIQDESDGAWYNQYSYSTVTDTGKSSTQTAEVMLGFYKLGYDFGRYSAMKTGAEYLMECQDTANKTGNDDGLICGGKDEDGNYIEYRYVSDNAFAYQALKATQDWATQAGETDFAWTCRDAAEVIIIGINDYLYDSENNIWHKSIDGNGIPRGDIINFPPEHRFLPDWLNFAPQMLDIPAFGVGQEIVGNWIHNNLQTYNNPAKMAGSVIRYEWDNNGLKVRESPGQFLMADLCWQDLGQVEYSRSGLHWFLNNSNLIQTRLDMSYIYGGSIDWREIEPDQSITAAQWLRFIDTSFYLIAGLSGGYSFTTYNEHAPVIDSYTPTDLVQEGNEGEGLQFTVSASDPDGDTITYKWLLDSEIVSDTATYNYLAGYSSAGWHVVKVIVSDNNNLSDEISWMVLIHDVIMPIEVEITHPEENSVISRTSIPIRGKATDGSQVEILVNDESQGTTTANLPLNINWSTAEDWSTWTSEAVTPYQDGDIGLAQVALGYNDDFNGEAIDPKWAQLRPPVNGWGVSEGRLYINMDSDEDFWEGNNTAPLLYQNAPVTDYELTVKVIGTPSADYQQGDLIIYQDDDNYIRLEKASFFGSSIIGASYEIDGVYWPLAYEDCNTDIVYLKIRKADTAYNLYYSTDGEKYIEIAYIDHEFNDPKIGLSAFSGTNAVRTLWFDDFKVHSIYTTGTLTSPPILLDATSLEGMEWSTEINRSDNFSNTSLMGWKEFRTPDNGWGIESGRFYINMDPNEDFYEITNTAPLLYQQAPGGDYEVSVKVEGAPGTNYQQAGLIIYQDDDNLLRFTKIHMDGPKLECAYEEDGIFTAITRIEYTSDIVYLRIQKSGERYYYSYSQDGGTYINIGVREQSLLTPKIGLSAFSSGTVTDVMTFYFDDFNITVNTAIQFQTRTGPNDGAENNLADWEEWRIVSGDGEIASTVNPFIQIRAIFNTNDNNTSPILDSIELNYNDTTDLRGFRLDGVLLNEGLNTIKAEATDFSDTASDGIIITLDSSPPVINNIILSDQNTGSRDYTTARTVNVNIVSDGSSAEMILSEKRDFAGANWIPYQDSIIFTLSYGDELKTVYCKLRDRAGNISQVVNDTIFLDTQAPQEGPTFVGGIIPVSTTWTVMGSPYIVYSTININSGATLIIAPGVTVKFTSGTSILIGGSLKAIGTEEQKITFTSVYSNPQTGDWDKIYFSDSSADSECILENCIIEYGGSAGNGNIHVYNSFPKIQNCSIKWSGSHGIYYNSSLPWEQYAGLSRNNISENALDGIHAESNSLRVIDNIITENGASGIYAYNAYLYISDNTISNNTSDGIHFGGSSVYIRFNSIINNTGNGIYTNGNSRWIEVNYNNIYGNNEGIYSDNTYPPDARYNWWGGAGGPSGIGPGTGDSVNNNVEYEPWLGSTFVKNFRIGDIEVYNRAFNPANNLPYITGHISDQANWAIKIKDSTDALVRELAGTGKAISQQWDARDGGGNSSPEGTYTYTIEATAANSGISTAPIIGQLIIDITMPQNPGITIDEGDNAVNQRIHLTLSCDGATEMILSENPDFSDAQWQSFASNIGFTISPGDGLKTVYAKFRDEARNESEIVSDSVTLDMPTYVSGRIDVDTTWTLANSPYIVTDHVYVYGEEDTPVTLTIEPGVEVRFDQSVGLFIRYRGNGGNAGILNAQGTTNQRIRFTANSINPVPGFWQDINFYGGDESTLSYCIIEYGGSQDSNIYCYYSSPSIRNCIIKDSGKSGIACNRATPNLRNNNIYNNVEYGLYNQTDSHTIHASLNWWGSSEEPASQISGNIIYVPWLGTEFTSPFNITTAGASPVRFTQNGNYTTIRASLSENANWVITIIDSNNNPVRSFNGNGTTISQDWNGTDASDTPLPDGIYYYKIEAISINTGQALSPAIGKLELAANIPIARITSPLTNTMFTGGGNIDIIGTAQSVGTGFNNYILQYGTGENPYSWSTFSTSNSPVTNGVLGSWDTTSYGYGTYTIKLTVTDVGGNIATDLIIVKIFTIEVDEEELWFSPNGDGINDQVEIYAEISYYADWSVTIKDAASLIVKTFTGSGTVINVYWDGKDAQEEQVPDGTYTFEINATEPDSGVSANPKIGSIYLDSIFPTAQITSPTPGSTIYDVVTITGTADDANFYQYKIEYGEGNSPENWTLIRNLFNPVVNGTLATWNTNLLSDGIYTIRLYVEDEFGNTSTDTVTINLNNIQITNVSASPVTINPAIGETATISYTIGEDATITIKLYNISNSPVKTLVNAQSRTAGTHSEIWDGRNDSGVVVSSEAYEYIIEATTGDGRYNKYDPQFTPRTNVLQNLRANTSFNPYNGETCNITYSLLDNAKVRIWIEHLFQGDNIRTISDRVEKPGNHLHIWDGRDDSGQIIDSDFGIMTTSQTRPPNSIIVDTSIEVISSLSAEAYLITPAYDQISTVYYTLSYPAEVTIKIYDPNGNYIKTLLLNSNQTAESHTIEWHGTTDGGTLVYLEGAYKARITAVVPQYGVTETKQIYIRVFK